MPERTRPIRKEICLNETEWNIILQKMQAQDPELRGIRTEDADRRLYHSGGLH